MEYAFKLEQGLKQLLLLRQQLMLNAQLMKLPPLALDSLIADIAENPEEYEKNLMSKKETIHEAGKETNSNVRCFFDFYKNFYSTKKAEGGVITSITPEIIPEDRLSKFNIEEIVIDGIYKMGSQDKPKFIASKPLNSFPKMQLLQIPKEYKNTKILFNDLIRKRDWIIRNLTEVYSYLGECQREFIYSLNPEKFNRCSYEDLASRLNLKDSSTTYRLIKNRNIAIKNKGKDYIFPTRLLIVNYNNFKLHQIVGKINSMFAKELKEHCAMPDGEISCLIKRNYKIDIPRRTIASYRKKAGIPNYAERQLSYDSKEQKAFVILTEVNKLIKCQEAL